MVFIKVLKLVKNNNGSVMSGIISILVTEYHRSGKHFFFCHRSREKLGRWYLFMPKGKHISIGSLGSDTVCLPMIGEDSNKITYFTALVAHLRTEELSLALFAMLTPLTCLTPSGTIHSMLFVYIN